MEYLCKFAYFVREYQTLLTGFCAIGAAVIAYRAARLHIHEEKRAAAAAIWGELIACGTQLHGQAFSFKATSARVSSMLPVASINTPVFDSEPALVGKLTADATVTVVTIYSRIKATSSQHAVMNGRHNQVDENFMLSHTAWLSALGDQAYSAADAIRISAGVSERHSDSVTGAYRPKKTPAKTGP